MKKLLTNIAILFSLVLLTLVLFWNLQGYGSSGMAALLDKHERLDSLDAMGKPKIIIVGGSNCPYGFNSALMEEKLHMPVADLGLHAGFGLRFILNDARDYVRKGDVVILSPEYLDFVDNEYNGEEALNELLLGNYPAGLKKLQPPQIGSFLSNLGPYMGDLISRPIESAFVSATGTNREENRKLKQYIGCRASYNAWGDFSIPPDFQLSFKVAPMQIDGKLNQDCFAFVRAFKRYVESRGAVLVITPQSLQRSSYDLSTAKIGEIDSTMKSMGMPFHSACDKYALPDPYFFNTVNHLDHEGQTLRTELVSEEIAQVLTPPSRS